MFSIWKYPIPIEDFIIIEMPADAKILGVQCQNGKPQMWAMIDPNLSKEQRVFRVIGTGQVIPEQQSRFSYIGTFQIESKGLVFHLFEYFR